MHAAPPKKAPKFGGRFIKATGEGEQFEVTFVADTQAELAARLKEAGDVGQKRLLMSNDKVMRATDEVGKLQRAAVEEIRAQRTALEEERAAFRAEREAAAAGTADVQAATNGAEADGAAAAP